MTVEIMDFGTFVADGEAIIRALTDMLVASITTDDTELAAWAEGASDGLIVALEYAAPEEAAKFIATLAFKRTAKICTSDPEAVKTAVERCRDVRNTGHDILTECRAVIARMESERVAQ